MRLETESGHPGQIEEKKAVYAPEKKKHTPKSVYEMIKDRGVKEFARNIPIYFNLLTITLTGDALHLANNKGFGAVSNLSLLDHFREKNHDDTATIEDLYEKGGGEGENDNIENNRESRLAYK
ncbi:MAG: hypothetical protein PHU56_03545 [Candidatus Pacebacteria bacterium]|nr:hypothetical protein [Candidatus Paceibacterota bacterium]